MNPIDWQKNMILDKYAVFSFQVMVSNMEPSIISPLRDTSLVTVHNYFDNADKLLMSVEWKEICTYKCNIK